MTFILTILHIIVCIFLILVVLLQTGKGGDLASTFGGSSTQTVFGTRGAATLLSKLTVVAAVVFILTSLTLAVVSSGKSESIMDEVPEKSAAPVERGETADIPPVPATTEDIVPAPEEGAPVKDGTVIEEGRPADEEAADNDEGTPESSAEE